MIHNSRLAWLVAFAVTMVLAVSQASNAQPDDGRRERVGPGGRRFGGGFGSPMLRLAMNEKVQQALTLSDDQKTKVGELDKQFRKDFRKLLEDRSGFEGMQKLSEETAAKLAEVLDDEQQKRLQGISIQAYGAGAALFDPALAKELNVTDEQRSKLREVQQSARRDGFRGLRDLSGDERRAKEEEIRAAVDKKLLEVLSPEQQETLDSLKGEKVEIDMSELRGPGRLFERRGGERGPRERGDRDRDDSDSDRDGGT